MNFLKDKCSATAAEPCFLSSDTKTFKEFNFFSANLCKFISHQVFIQKQGKFVKKKNEIIDCQVTSSLHIQINFQLHKSKLQDKIFIFSWNFEICHLEDFLMPV